MSKGFSTDLVPILVAQGIEGAFHEWLDMTGKLLRTAPEYFVTVKVAQHLCAEIPAEQRTLLMEHEVSSVLRSAGGVQRGPASKHLRAGGRMDLVLGRADGRPRVVIELKNGLYLQMNQGVRADLHRLCHALLQGKNNTHLHSGLLAFFTSTRPPLTKRDSTARAYLRRRWLTEFRPLLQDWRWAGNKHSHYEKNLRINVGIRLHDLGPRGDKGAWAVVVVRVRRLTAAEQAQQAKSASNQTSNAALKSVRSA